MAPNESKRLPGAQKTIMGGQNWVNLVKIALKIVKNTHNGSKWLQMALNGS